MADWARVSTFLAALPGSVSDVVSTASIGDPDGTRTVISIVALLVAIGVALVLLAIWIHRTTRPDPELLAPLEVMGERSWRRGDPVWQRRRLDELRPSGAKPLAPSVAPPEFDASFDEGPSASGFEDLRSGSRPGSQSGPVPIVPAAASEPAAGDDTEAALHDPGDERVGEEPAPDATPPDAAAPIVLEFPDEEFDPEALAAAREVLERELADASGAELPHRQLDLFGRDSDS